MNGPSASDVAAAVQAVLAALQEPDRHAPGTGFFAGRLLGVRHVDALEAGMAEVRITPGTVVTPLARDALKRRGITLRLVAPGELERHGASRAWGFVIERGVTAAEALRRAILAELETWHDVGDDHLAAALWVAASENRSAVVLTPEASVATWRACQVPRVRAAAVADPDAVLRACRHLDANLLVIEPRGQSLAAIRHLVATCRRAPRSVPPEAPADRTPLQDGQVSSHGPTREPLVRARTGPDPRRQPDSRLVPAEWEASRR